MWFEDCLNWEYKGHPQYSTVADECALILEELQQDRQVHQPTLGDSRSAHLRIFSSVVPVACTYLAGNYRGLVIGCLANYRVKVGPHYGTVPNLVQERMVYLHQDLAGALQVTDAAASRSASSEDKKKLLGQLVDLCASVLERFLTIHPYANGNGHIARLLVWILLIRYGFHPVRWTLDQSPPSYGDLIQKYRDGDQKPLKVFIYKAIIGA